MCGEMEIPVIRLLVVGDPGTPKYDFVKKFLHEDCLDSTPGPVDYQARLLMIEKESVKVQIWDTSGQERFRSMTSAFFSKSAGVILLFDITRRETFESLSGWIQDIQRNAPQTCEIILCASYFDNIHWEVSQEEIDVFSLRYNLPFHMYDSNVSLVVKSLVSKILQNHRHTLQLCSNSVSSDPVLVFDLPPRKPRIWRRIWDTIEYKLWEFETYFRNEFDGVQVTETIENRSILERIFHEQYNFRCLKGSLLSNIQASDALIDEFELEQLFGALKWILCVRDEDETLTEDQFNLMKMECPQVFSAEKSSPSLVDHLRLIRERVLNLSLEMALNEGSCAWRRSRLLVVGSGGTGKTSFINSLRDIRHNNNHVSTAFITKTELLHCHSQVIGDSSCEIDEEVQSIGVNINDFDNNWQTNVESDLLSNLKYSMAKLYYGVNPRICDIKVPSTSGSVNICLMSDPLKKEELHVTVGDYHSPKGKQLPEEGNSIKSLSEKSIFDFSKVGAPSSLDAKGLMISVWDFGGQEVFQTVQHLFMARTGVYAVVFNLIDLLCDDDGNLLSYTTSASDNITLSENNTKNNVSFIRTCRHMESWLRLIHLYANGAPIFLIGTHFDCVMDLVNKFCPGDLKIIQSHVGNILRQCIVNVCPDLIRCVVSPSRTSRGDDDSASLFWELDNRNRNDKFLSLLREEIVESIVKDPLAYVDRPIPLAWYALCDRLRALSKDHPYILREKLTTETSNDTLSFDSLVDEYGLFSSPTSSLPDFRNQLLSAMLRKFHELGVFLYFEKKFLSEYIILDSQWLINKIVYLIRDIKRHRFARDRIALTRCPLKWDRLFVHGILHEKLLRIFWRDDENIVEFLLHVVEELGLLCLMGESQEKDEKIYFIPASVLYLERGCQYSSMSLSNRDYSVVIQFDGLIPSGFVDRLLVSLVKLCSDLYSVGDELNELICEDHGEVLSHLLLKDDTDNMREIFSAFMVSRGGASAIGFLCDECNIRCLMTLLEHHSTTIVSTFLQSSVSFQVLNCKSDQKTSNTDVLFETSSNWDDDAILLSDEVLCENKNEDLTFGFQAIESWLRASLLSESLISKLTTYLVEAGFIGDDAVKYLRCRYEEESEISFRSFLCQIGIESTSNQTILINLLKQLPPYSTSLPPYCICFCETDHYDLFEDILELKRLITLKGFKSRPFSLASMIQELNCQQYEVMLLCASSAPFNSSTGEMFTYRRTLEDEMFRSSNMTSDALTVLCLLFNNTPVPFQQHEE